MCACRSRRERCYLCLSVVEEDRLNNLKAYSELKKTKCTILSVSFPVFLIQQHEEALVHVRDIYESSTFTPIPVLNGLSLVPDKYHSYYKNT